jgi:hypothetical protein
MDYQMLIIGWSLASDPVGNVFDIVGPRASSNTFGFWSEANPNPFYKDLFGVVTRGDAQSQALADEVLVLEDLAKSSFNVSDQIKYTRWAEGVLADALPCNVLYYRVNVEAATNRWTGWVSYLGQIFGPGANLFSLSKLEKSGAAGGGAVATATVNAGLSLPGKVLEGDTASAYVTVIDSTGAPVSAAAIVVAVAGVGGGTVVTPSATSGSTSAAGVFAFNLTGTAAGYSYVNVTATKGTVTSTASGTIRVVTTLPKTLAMMVSADKLVLAPGETSDVVVTVTDEAGAAVEDANVTIDPNLVSYGTINWTHAYALTNADGEAYMRYTAPTSIAAYLNSHLTLSLSYAATASGYAWSAAAAANLLIYNSAAPDWTMAQVDPSTTGTVSLTRAANTTAIVVNVTDDNGNPLATHNLTVEYSNVSLVFDPVEWVVTDGAGQATVDVQFKDSAESSALRVVIVNKSALNAVPATITLTYGGTAPYPEMYGGYMVWDIDGNAATQEPQFMAPMGDITATAYVWDNAGVPATGINASLIVSGTAYGSLSWSDLINWDSTFDGWGINIITGVDNANLVTSGPFNTYYNHTDWDYWYNTAGYIYWNWTDDTLPGNPQVMTGVSITGGKLTIAISGQAVAPIDLIGKVYVVPKGVGSFNGDTLAYNIIGPTTISGDYSIGRSYAVAAATLDIAKPVMTVKATGFDSTVCTVIGTDENNAPIDGARAKVYQNSLRGNLDYTIIPSGTVPTNADGEGSLTMIAEKANLVTQASVRADVFATATVSGAISLFAQNQVVMHVAQAYVTLDPIQTVQKIGDKIAVTATVTNSAGGAVPNLPVELTTSGGATVTQAAMASDASGHVTFELDTSGITGARAAFVPVQAKCGGIAYEVGLATMSIPVMNEGPTISVLSPAASAEVVKKNVVMTASVSDMNGVQTVKLSVDGGTVTTVQGTAGETTWDITEMLGNLTKGSHSVKVNATDSLGISTETTVTFTAINEKAGTSMAVLGGLVIGWILAVVFAVMWFMMRPKKPEAEAAAAAEPEPAKPEEPKL